MSSDSPEPSPAGCGVCGSPTADQGQLCRLHTDSLATDLASVPARWEFRQGRRELVLGLAGELEVTITRQARTAPDNQGVRSPERPLPWHEGAADAAFVLNATLNAWALDVSQIGEDERDPLRPIQAHDTAEVAAWLGRNLHTLRMHAEAGTAHSEIASAIEEARRAIDRPQGLIPFGACNTMFPGTDIVCTAILYGHLDRPSVRCRACETPHRTADRLKDMLEYLQGMLATLPELVGIAKLAGRQTSEDKLRLMASPGRDRFAAVATDGKGKPMYRVSDVLKALEERYKHRPKAA